MQRMRLFRIEKSGRNRRWAGCTLAHEKYCLFRGDYSFIRGAVRQPDAAFISGPYCLDPFRTLLQIGSNSIGILEDYDHAFSRASEA